MNDSASLPQACTKLLHEKMRRKLTFAEIAQHLGHDEVWTAALFYGRASPTLKDIHKLANLLSLSIETLEDDFRMGGPPLRQIEQPAPDPIIGPLRDTLALYAPAIRSVVVEKMGDGAISAPHTKVRVERVDNGRSGSIRVVLDSKYVQFQSW
ncbi:Cyanate hydratase [Coemansia erecta]|nr:Cyanate hydratase [Coemansia sp. RSA 2618]KAJ2815049.1 Cyanate hydratase [Coemansia erecta]